MKPNDTLKLYMALRRHRKLAARRDANRGQSQAAKVIIWFAAAFICIYLIGFAVLLATIANESSHTSSVDLLCCILPLVSAIDFGARFLIQQTPAQLVRPYLLLPVPKNTCINGFIISSITGMGNFLWFFMFIPYIIMSVVFSYGIVTSLLLIAFLTVTVMIFSQWYAIIRALINDKLYFWAIPTLVYAAFVVPFFTNRDDLYIDTFSAIGEAITDHSILPLALSLLLLCVLVAVNRNIQRHYVMAELMHTKSTKVVQLGEMNFLKRFGTTGMFLKLELATLLRNKNPRKSFLYSIAIVVAFSIIITFTSTYDTRYMTHFWALYNFIVMGSTLLTKLMGNEGNYIDGLMVRRDMMRNLLHAKYIFYSVMLLLPFVLMLPMVFVGKWSLLMLVSFGIFTAGFQYFVLFQLAVFNKQTYPLNERFNGKATSDNMYWQMLIQFALFIIPITLLQVLQALFSETISYIIMLAIGIVFIATSNIWIGNIYRRFMNRRYENMESFRATR